MNVGEVVRKIHIAENLRSRIEDKGVNMNHDDEIMFEIVEDYIEILNGLKVVGLN